MSRCGECKLGCNEKGSLFCEENLGHEQCIDRLQDALYELSADKPNERWISCGERLPEDPNPSFTYASKTYQVTTASGEVVALKWQKTKIRDKTVMRWEWSSGVIYHGDALAWKPLSEPWKGADDGE